VKMMIRVNDTYIIFTMQKRMKVLIVLAALVGGFLVYFFIRDKLFDIHEDGPEKFEVPAPGPIEIRQAPLYPQRVAAPSGPNPPSQSGDSVVTYGDPQAKDPYHESQENSDIPERMRNPENSFRPAPAQDQHQLAVQAGVASNRIQTSSDNSQQFAQEFIQGGGEFMPGIFANDTFTDTNFSSF
jgi:hypothetical protein